MSVLTIGEIRKGIDRLPDSRKRRRIEAWLNNDLRQRFTGRIVAVDDEVAERWGLESAKAALAGTPLPVRRYAGARRFCGITVAGLARRA